MGIVAQFEGLRDPLTQSLMLWSPPHSLPSLNSSTDRELTTSGAVHSHFGHPWPFESLNPLGRMFLKTSMELISFVSKPCFVPFNIISVSFTSLNYLEFLHVYKTTYLQICLHTRRAIYHCYFTKQYITNIFSLQLSYLSFLIFNAQIILYCWIYHNLFNHCLSVGL